MQSERNLLMRRIVIALFSLVAVNTLTFSSLRADGLGGSDVATASISDELQGGYPIHVPELQGVEQLLILSDRWVIVVSNKMRELFEEIDTSSAGALTRAVKTWKQSEKRERPDWKAYRDRWRIRDRFMAGAREAVGERRLGQTDFFTIQSTGDSRYKKPVHPARADRLLVSAGKARTTGGVFNINYHVYSYLELPTPMQSGRHYKIMLGDGTHVSFVYDLKTTVSRAIKVNQVGYLPDAGRKRAYLGAYLYRFGPLDLSHADRFEVINVSSGKVAFKGKVELLEANPRFAPKNQSQDPLERPTMYGEDVYVADFTGLKEEGVYFISVPGVGRSWPFRHTASVYGPAFYTATRALFHQRAGTSISERFTPWTRTNHQRGPYCESEHIAFPGHTGGPENYQRFDVIGGSIDCSKTKKEIPGGWHDAADWDSNADHYTVVFDLLNAFAFYPHRFTDGQLNIPESGNGVPDILDEVRYGLEIWRHSMDERGGVSGMLETRTHLKIDNIEGKYAFAQRTRWTSLTFAAAAAQYAQLVKPYHPEDALRYQEAAEKAFKFGNSRENSLRTTTIHAREKRGKGKPYTIEWTEEETHIQPFVLHAKLRLFLLTKDKEYLAGVRLLATGGHKPYQWHFTRKDFSPWIYFSIIEASYALPGSFVREWRYWFIKDADQLLNHLNESPYSITFPRKQDFWLAWGASDMTNMNRALFIGYKLTGNKKYRNAAILNTDFMLGANPMGMVWTTGLGFVYPVDIQHEMSEIDKIYDPVPGITIYGITGGPIYHKFRERVWQSTNQGIVVNFVNHDSHRKPPLWRRWMAHPGLNVGQNEFTIQETISSTIFTTAMLMPDDWKPDDKTLTKKPKNPDSLFGRWYLP